MIPHNKATGAKERTEHRWYENKISTLRLMLNAKIVLDCQW
jgi:hypothetical protein